MEFDWVKTFLQNEARHHPRAAGYYNHNYVVKHNKLDYLIRVPIPNSDTMDLRLIPETQVLQFLQAHNFPAPRLLFSAEDNSFSVHSFIEGKVLNSLQRDYAPFPDWIAQNLAAQFYQLHTLCASSLEPYCTGLATSPQTQPFFLALVNFVKAIYALFKDEYQALFKQVLIPDEPFGLFEELSHQLVERTFVISHSDIHAKNLILTPANNLVIIDWELVLVADPYYDIAIHFHKMRYLPSQEDLFLRTYLELSGKADDFDFAKGQIGIYRKLERVKSAIVDSVRYSKDFKNLALSEESKRDYAFRYHQKLKYAWEVWGIEPGNYLAKPEQVLSVLLG